MLDCVLFFDPSSGFEAVSSLPVRRPVCAVPRWQKVVTFSERNEKSMHISLD